MPPEVLSIEPLDELVLEEVQAEEHVLCLPEFRWCAVQYAPWQDQFLRVQQFPAVVALVSTGFLKTAVGAFSFDVPVRHEPVVRGAERRYHCVLGQQAFPVEIQELHKGWPQGAANH